MKKYWIYTLLAVATLSMTACSGESKEETEEKSPTCTYSYDKSSTTLEWTAFKFTEKAPVKGSFNVFNVDALSSSEDAMKLIESMSITIETNSVETQNEERNGKIAKHFFETIETPMLKGKMKSISDNGKATIAITMNNKTEDVVGDYTLEGDVFSFHATIDVAKWDAVKGIDALNEICKVLHTGADGKSKLWSEVDLSFSTTLKTDCK